MRIFKNDQELLAEAYDNITKNETVMEDKKPVQEASYNVMDNLRPKIQQIRDILLEIGDDEMGPFHAAAAAEMMIGSEKNWGEDYDALLKSATHLIMAFGNQTIN